jgi:serine/threonine protein kinase/tetratricopeptide (TPR) repeat protein
MTERDVFIAALQKDDPAERQAYLDEACARQPELRKQVETLLRLYEGAGSFLEQPAAELPATGALHEAAESAPSPEAPGALIGPYKLLEQIGEGGMGTVWMAQQQEPVKRLVAIKLVKAGMDSRQVIARFEAERQALALMDHANIARVLDAGATSAGRPYFVMDLVKGVPITRYCDEHRLTPGQRLELFLPVCQAVQHAHQKGVIHRDLKPSNVLVALYDGKPVPKVIDFGVAKAAGQPLTDKTLVTGFGAIVGTLEYMSPEQAEVNQLDIDTRSDIYSLGVLLYELLTGSPPFSRKELEKAGMLEMLRVIREQEPSRPSTKLSSSDALPALSAKRSTEPAKLTKLVRGELDWIVMKALEKDRGRRYETANGFATDVQRYLAGEPVLAVPPSQWYRLTKFARRNKSPVIAVGTVLLALLAGVVGTALGLIEAKRQERIAVGEAGMAEAARRLEAEQRNKAEEAAREATQARLQTQTRLEQIQKGNKLLGSIFADLDLHKLNEEGQKLELVLGERLKAAAAGLKGDTIGDPRVVAELQAVLAESLRGLSYYREAIGLDEEARATCTRLLGPEHYDTLTCMVNLGKDYVHAGQFDKALPLLEEALARVRATLGAEHPLTLGCMGSLATAYQEAGQIHKGVPLLEETFTFMKKKHGPDHPTTLVSMNNLATAYQHNGQPEKALPLAQETFERMKRALPPDHPAAFLCMSNLAGAYMETRQCDKALPLFEETFTRTRTKLGPNHHATLVSMANLAAGYRETGKVKKALPLAEEAFTRAKATLGPDHLNTLIIMITLASTYLEAGQADKGLALAEEALTRMKTSLGPDHPRTLEAMRQLASDYRKAGRLENALPLLEVALPRLRAKFGVDHPYTVEALHNLGVGYMMTRQLDKAIPLLEESLKRLRATLGPDHPDSFHTMLQLVGCYLEARRPSQAEKLLVEVIALQRRKTADGPELAGFLAALGKCLLDQEKFANAEPTLRESLTLREKAEPDAWSTFSTRSLLGGALLGQKKYADAEPLLLKGYEGMKQRADKIPAPIRTDRLTGAVERLVRLYEATGKKDQAARWRKELNAAKAAKDKTKK